MKKLPFNIGDVLSLRLRDDLFTLAQVKLPSYVSFFDIANRDGKWAGVDLSTTPLLFCIVVATTRLKSLVSEKLNHSLVQPDLRPMERLFIKPNLNSRGGYPFLGGNLIEIDERGETTQRPVVKRNLSVSEDEDLIRKHELTNMWNDPEAVKNRLIRYFDTGVNWDPHKEKVFPGIAP